MSNVLQDSYGRVMRKLRISLLDTCNFSCTYCMPESASFSKVHDLLNADEIFEITSNLTKLGIEEVRLTGGEPTIRHELVEIVDQLSNLPLQSLALTTNGYHLKKHLDGLKQTKLTKINISLDTLNKKKFFDISKVDGLDKVINAIDSAIELGFKVKLNTVLLNENRDEIDALIDFAKTRGVEIRFLELMKIGVAIEKFNQSFVPAAHVIFDLRRKYILKEIPVALDSTAFKYRLDSSVDVGFIASESMPFCGNCSRLRLDSKGSLRSCLMQEDKLNLRGLKFEDYPEVVSKIISLKPNTRVEKVDQPMYQIGG